MRNLARAALVLVLLWPVSASADLSATTADGRPVILHDNGTWVFAPQTPPGNAPPPASDATCQAYADYSVNQQRVNLAQHCGNTGIHWSLDRQWHYSFCMSAPPAERQAISQARINALSTCSGPGATPPGNAQPPANDATCQAYADYAVNQQRVNLNQHCGNTGIHWNLDRQWHYDFCMSAPPAERQAISQARVNALASCAPQGGGTGGGEGGNLIVNGGFESPRVGYWSLGTTNLPGWAVTRDNIDIVGTYWQQPEGAQSIDLAGQSGSGAIAQSVATQPGRTYTLSFVYAGNPTCDAPFKQMLVGYGGQSLLVSFDTTGRSIEAMGWHRYSLTFVATGASTPISFANAGPNRGCGIALDQVELR